MSEMPWLSWLTKMHDIAPKGKVTQHRYSCKYTQHSCISTSSTTNMWWSWHQAQVISQCGVAVHDRKCTLVSIVTWGDQSQPFWTHKSYTQHMPTVWIFFLCICPTWWAPISVATSRWSHKEVSCHWMWKLTFHTATHNSQMMSCGQTQKHSSEERAVGLINSPIVSVEAHVWLGLHSQITRSL